MFYCKEKPEVVLSSDKKWYGNSSLLSSAASFFPNWANNLLYWIILIDY